MFTGGSFHPILRQSIAAEYIEIGCILDGSYVSRAPPSIVQEILRFCAPAPMVPNVAMADVQLSSTVSTTIAAGEVRRT